MSIGQTIRALHLSSKSRNDVRIQLLENFIHDFDQIKIGKLLISRGADINAKDKANQTPLHRAATTGSVGFIRILIDSSTPTKKLRFNTGDRIGNTPLHLAMDSGHAEAAVILINAGADRERENLDQEMPEDVPGLGGMEQKRIKEHVLNACGPR
ncbi:ankyrin repeat-containing domain protein [Flagelloscypha sp. PMI_526]|nr:ankyrin repeat-containing domain protein [Flagelloscypha sp. PMI_526]